MALCQPPSAPAQVQPLVEAAAASTMVGGHCSSLAVDASGWGHVGRYLWPGGGSKGLGGAWGARFGLALGVWDERDESEAQIHGHRCTVPTAGAECNTSSKPLIPGPRTSA